MDEKYLLKIYDPMLKNYRTYIADIKEEQEGAKGKYVKYYYPLLSRKYLTWVIDSLEKMNIDVARYKEEVSRVDAEFKLLKDSASESYMARLYKEYIDLINRYDPDDIFIDVYEFENVIHHRTEIEVLTEALEKHIELSECKTKIGKIDTELKDRIKSSIAKKTYSPVDLPYAPPSYWWLHLEDVYGSFDEVHGIPEYEDKDPDEVIESGEKVLEMIADSDYKQELEKMIEAAKEAKKQGKKLRIYYR